MFRIKDYILHIAFVLVILGILWKTKVIENIELQPPSSGSEGTAIVDRRNDRSTTRTDTPSFTDSDIYRQHNANIPVDEKIRSINDEISVLKGKISKFETELTQLKSNYYRTSKQVDQMRGMRLSGGIGGR